MKKIIVIIASFILCCVCISCATLKTKTTDKSVSSVVSDTTIVKIQDQTINIDTSKTTTKVVKIVEMEFFGPSDGVPPIVWQIDQDTFVYTGSSQKEGVLPDTIPLELIAGVVGSDRPPNYGGLKKITITQIGEATDAKGISNTTTSSNDSIRVNRNEEKKNDVQVDEKPVDPYRWRYIAIAILGIFAIIVAIFFLIRWLIGK